MVPPGIEGIVVDVKVFSRTGIEKDERAKSIESDDIERLRRGLPGRGPDCRGREVPQVPEDPGGEDRARSGHRSPDGRDDRGPRRAPDRRGAPGPDRRQGPQSVSTEEPHAAGEDEERIEDIEEYAEDQLQLLETIFDEKMGRLKRGDELQPGVLKLVRVYVAMKRKIQVGDKVAGRHGNKGVIARVLPEEDMPFLPTGDP